MVSVAAYRPLTRSLHASSRAARELPRRVRRPPHDGADVLERQRKQIVKHEGHALGRTQRIEHDHHGGAHGVGEQDLALRIGRLGFRRPAFGDQRGRRVLARLPRPEHVEAHARNHRGEPATEVVHFAGFGPRDPQPRLLHGVFGVGHRAQQAVRDRTQTGPVLLKSRAQGRVCHIRLLSFVTGMTDHGHAS